MKKSLKDNLKIAGMILFAGTIFTADEILVSKLGELREAKELRKTPEIYQPVDSLKNDALYNLLPDTNYIELHFFTKCSDKQ